MKFAEIKVVRLNNDVITTSIGGGFDYDNCDCYDSSIAGDPCNDE